MKLRKIIGVGVVEIGIRNRNIELNINLQGVATIGREYILIFRIGQSRKEKNMMMEMMDNLGVGITSPSNYKT